MRRTASARETATRGAWLTDGFRQVIMDRENAEFYVTQSALGKKLNKIKRNVKTGSSVLVSMLNNDYSGKKLAFSWDDRPSRFDLINGLIEAYAYDSYLEIGCSTDLCFQRIAAKNKLGVDPFSGGTHRMTSDEFFAGNREKFDIIFVDGLHQYGQVRTDLLNSLQALNDTGVILVHDCLPLTYRAQLPFPAGGAWNGDVWKAFVEMRTHAQIDSAVCLIDHGVGIVKKRQNRSPLSLHPGNFIELRFKDFVENYQAWLNTITYEQALKFPGAA
jgi:hypothetical protein